MTNQEALDKVWDWFIVKGNPFGVTKAVGGMGQMHRCVFWGDEGKLRCAIGCLVTSDQAYDLEKDRACLEELRDGEPERWDLLELPDDVGFLESLQSAHDTATDADESVIALMQSLERVALRFNLKVPVES